MDIKDPPLDVARSMGIRDLAVLCPACGERFAVPISAIDLPGDVRLSQVAAIRPLACPNCSASGEIELVAMGFLQ